MDCLNNGYVELIEHMGGDEGVIRAARRCWDSESKGAESDRKLIRHLLREGHKTPFEFMQFVFDIKAPLFVARQWMRHRIGGYCERSLRYCAADKDYYVPEGLNATDHDDWHNDMGWQWKAYDYYLSRGVPKEQARSLLPLGTYTKFYWTVNGSSLMNFLRLRMDSHAQAEIREYAHAILHLVREVAPVSFGEWDLLNGVK